MTDSTQILTKAQVTLFRSLKQSKFRKQEGLFLLEGVRLSEEALNSKLEITACITAKGFDKLAIPDQLPQFEANRTQLEQISDSTNSQGIICVAKIPNPENLPQPKPKTVLLVTDHIADPGNMGTIFRSALWFGVKDVLLGPGCVDSYNPKVVRSSMGAIALLNLHFSDDLLTSAVDWETAGGEVAALHMTGDALDQYQLKEGLFLIVGSEAHGVSNDLLDLSTKLSIRKSGSGESLNAAMATGIALYELNRS